ncbi:MAG: MFS transporter [Acidimicrobiales bacterium]
MSEGPIKGWADVDIVASCVVGTVLLSMLVGVELRRHEPLLNLRLLGDRLFSLSNGVMFLASIGFIGTLYLLALFYQDGLGLSALQSGLSTFPEALGVMVGARFIANRLYPVLGPRRIMCGGLVVAAGATCALLLIGPATSLWWARLILFVMGFGMSGIFIPTQTAAFATISPKNMGGASTLFNTERQLGGAVGVAVLTTVLAIVGPFSHVAGHVSANLSAYRFSFLAAAGFMAMGAVLSLFVHDEDAIATITRWRRKDQPAALDGRTAMHVAEGPRSTSIGHR